LIEAAADHAGMLAILAASLLGGMVLGLRFRVLILVPVIIAGIVVIAIAGIGLRAAVWPIVTAMVANAVGLQVGYLIGICTANVLGRKRNGAPLSSPILSFDRAASRTPPPSSNKS
jgi:hypothetical protein